MAKKKTHRSDHRPILRIFIISVSVLVLLTAIVSIVLFETSYRERVVRQNAERADQAKEAAVAINNSAKRTMLQVSISPQYGSLMQDDISSENLSTLIVELSNLYAGAEEFPEFYLYILDYRKQVAYSLNTSQKVFSFENFFDRDILEYLPGIRKEKKFIPIPRHAVPGLDRDVLTYLYFEGGSLAYQNFAIVANVATDRLRTALSSIATEKDDFLVFFDGRLLTRTEHLKLPADRIAELAASSNPETFEFGHRTMLKWFTVDGIGFAMATDHSIISEPLYRIYFLIALNSTILIAVGVSISFPLSKNLLRDIEKKYEKQSPQTAVVRLLRQIGDSPIDRNFDLSACGIPETTQEAKLCLLIFHIDSWKKFARLYDSSERRVIRFGISNVAEESLSEFGTVKSFLFRDQILLSICDFMSADREKLLAVVRNTQEFIKTNFEITFTAAVSEIEDFRKIKNLFWDVKILSEYAFYSSDGTVLEGNIEEEPDRPVLTTVLSESFSLAANLDFDRLRNYVSEKLGMLLRESSPASARQTLAALIAQINDGIYTFSAKNSVDLSENIAEFSKIPNQSYKLSEYIENILTQLDKLRSVVRNVSSASISSKNIQLIEEVCRIVEQRFSDPNLTVKTIANEINISSVYLCKIFKLQKNVQLNTYLCEFRLAEAARLLKETNLTTKVISERCGFINTNYFYTLFKKYRKVTAREFQEYHRSHDQTKR